MHCKVHILHIEIFKASEVLILELCTLADIIYIYILQYM